METAPRNGLYALSLYGDAMGLPFPITRPAVAAAQRIAKRRKRRQSPMVPSEFVYKLEEYAACGNIDKNIRFSRSALFLQILASLRFSDAAQIATFSVTKTVVGWSSIDQRAKDGELISWAAPRRGLRSNGAWANPLISYWGKFKPRGGEYRHLYPSVTAKWVVGTKKRGTFGVTHAAFTKLLRLLGCPPLIKLHSPRCWFATYARQLLFGKEERTSIGRWRPGSAMPDVYDRAECAAELAPRDKIVSKIQSVRRPSGDFELPNTGEEDLADSSADSISESPTSPFIYKKRENISGLYN